MNLREYEGENVLITCSDGEKIKGFVTDYISPEDNEPEGVESLILDGLLEITRAEIKSIVVVS